MTNNETKQRLTEALTLLQIPGVGRGRYRRLVEAFGSPAGVLRQDIAHLEKVKGMSRQTASAVVEQADRERGSQVAARIIQLGWAAHFLGDQDYPAMLARTDDPPALLFRVGDQISDDDKMIAIVGTRHPSENGRLFAHRLAADLAMAGVTVVSGMAEGVDSAAHRGALDAGGRTIAVWGSSLDIVYPPSNRDLAEQIKQRGTIVSEYLPGTSPDRGTFPDRNRIISGLSEGVVVVEAGRKSGALITASQALAQGRELFAVPGSPQAQTSLGTNDLIRKGARLVASVDDIFDELPRLRGQVLARRFQQLDELTDDEKRITDLLGQGAQQLDLIARQAQMTVGGAMELLLALELKGVVKELAGKRYMLSDDI